MVMMLLLLMMMMIMMIMMMIMMKMMMMRIMMVCLCDISPRQEGWESGRRASFWPSVLVRCLREAGRSRSTTEPLLQSTII